MEYILCHAGIKGMKWGVRRYQNKDGSLTLEGKKRYYDEADKSGYNKTDALGMRYKNKDGDVEVLKADAYKYAAKDGEAVEGVLRDGRSATNALKNLNETSIRISKKNRPQMDLSNMSDKEMRDQINRAMLERQYNDMFAPQKSTKGREYVNDILSVTGDVLTVGASAVAIAVGIWKLKSMIGG